MQLSLSSTMTLNNGVQMPMFGLGTYLSPQGTATREAVQAALRVGYRLLDTAAAYGNEADVGAAIAESGIAREEIFVTTKVWIDDQGAKATPSAFRQSLQALGLDYLDLYLIHWPAPSRWQQAWTAMQGLLDSGACRAIGVSNFEIHHLEELRRISSVLPAVNQVEFSPFLYRKALLEYCSEQGIRLEAYSPLTRGEKFNDPRLRNIAKKYGKSPAQILIRWPLQHGVIVIPKSVHAARIREDAEVFDFEIAPEDMAILDSMNEDFYTISAGWRARFA